MLRVTLSGERASRNFSNQFEGLADLENLEKQRENKGELSPGEAGKALGEFLNGIEKATQQEE